MLTDAAASHKKRRLPLVLLLVCVVSMVALFARLASQQERDARLIAAINRQDADVVVRLLAEGANPNARDISDAPSFFVQFLRRFSPRAAPPRVVNPGGPNRPVLVAALIGLFRQRTDVGLVPDANGENVSDAAVIAIIRALLDKGADVRPKDSNAAEPVWIAAMSDSGEAVSLLAAHGADLDLVDPGDGMTPLMLAAQHDYRSAARQLLTCGANPNAKNWQGKTPLMLARENGNQALARLLLSQSAPHPQ